MKDGKRYHNNAFQSRFVICANLAVIILHIKASVPCRVPIKKVGMNIKEKIDISMLKAFFFSLWQSQPTLIPLSLPENQSNWFESSVCYVYTHIRQNIWRGFPCSGQWVMQQCLDSSPTQWVIKQKPCWSAEQGEKVLFLLMWYFAIRSAALLRLFHQWLPSGFMALQSMSGSCK